ncbi:MAG: preprotein translocase subunit SecG [Bacteroidales bacterium]|jgi:preprotein translocase subunit SecG|nr:preprotein translocase subunit SecG [Bacteroidales bacterium]
MYTLITVLILIVCILLILIVLVQNSKGGGLASSFQSSNQVMGVRKTADFLEKGTWFLAGALIIFSITGSVFIPRDRAGEDQSMIRDQIDNTIDPSQTPIFPSAEPEVQTPVQEQESENAQ